MEDKLTEILNDNQSGSVVITKKAFHYFRNIVDLSAENSFNREELFVELQEAVKRLLKTQPNMVLLRKTSTNLLIYMKRLLKAEKEDSEILTGIYHKLEQIENDIDGKVTKIAQTGSRIIAHNNKIMTISNSMMVRQICLQAHQQKRKFEVYALKSHPPDEGIMFGRLLAEQGLKTTIIPDSAMGVFLPETNLVLVGADRICEDGFVNKAGTLPLCLTAREFNIPVYLAVDTSKILKESERAVKIIKQDKQEVCSDTQKNLNVENVYFEKIPLRLVHKIICEEGIYEYEDFINWYLKE